MEQSQEHSEPQQEEYGLHRCSFHPEVETGLGCGKCGRYICPRCMIQTPVGARCRECARVTTIPTFDVSSPYYVRAALAGGMVAIVGGVVWGLTAHIPYLPWLIGLGVGYLVGESISVATNRKRGRGLAIIAGVSMALCVVILLISARGLPIYQLIIVAIAFYLAITRVR